MKKVLVFSVLAVLTQDSFEIFVLFVLLLLLHLSIVIAKTIERYLVYRRFTKECDELFTEEFYTRLNNIILKNELE